MLHGPTLRTVDLSHDEALRAATQDLVERPPSHLVATTAQGMRWWLEAAAGWGLEGALKDALGRARVLARGAKAQSALRQAGFAVAWRAPHEAMDEVVEHLRAEAPRRVALQLFDPEGADSTRALRELAAELVEVPVYRWLPPEDPGPARLVVEAAVAGDLAAVTFTSQPAVRHLFRLADDAGRADALRAALNGPVLAACIGPVCAEAAVACGVREPVWPEPPRLPAMVRQVTERLAPG